MEPAHGAEELVDQLLPILDTPPIFYYTGTKYKIPINFNNACSLLSPQQQHQDGSTMSVRIWSQEVVEGESAMMLIDWVQSQSLQN